MYTPSFLYKEIDEFHTYYRLLNNICQNFYIQFLQLRFNNLKKPYETIYIGQFEWRII